MKKSQRLLHGGDYNPEQWLGYPGIIDQDFELFRDAHLNVVTVGVFSWAALEPEEGKYEFGWLEDIFSRAEKQGMDVILSTPSGGKPNWMALKYPEIRRVNPHGVRDPQERRHNHCLTSPIYRDKTRAINEQLAARFGSHPALILWHISNELNGYCYCDLCMAAFQRWLEEKYKTLDALNDAYWSRFWSHTYTAWDQIRHIDKGLSGLVLDWKRFMTSQCCDFIRNEREPLRRLSPEIPVTTNMMNLAQDYDYCELAKEIDVVSWDSYPMWHTKQTSFHESNQPLAHAFAHDLFRSMKGGQPFYLMETTPSQVNWAGTSPLRRPGVHRLGSMQALAHGADAICYFQLRKSRGSCEQFHGAVIDHVGHGRTRVFQEVAALGKALEGLPGLVGARVPARVAVIFDWNVLWCYLDTATPQNREKHYVDTVLAHYKPFWEQGIAVDVVNSEADFQKYDMVVAPLLFLISEETASRLTSFVEGGGTLVTTYGSAMVDEHGLSILGGVPGPLRKVLGIWVEEFDALPEPVRKKVRPGENDMCGLSGSYEARHYLELIHLEGAEAVAFYGEDFYDGMPALTRNRYGKGEAWHIASRNDDRFTTDLFRFLSRHLHLPRAVEGELPSRVTAHVRVQDGTTYLFLLNFNDTSARLDLGKKCYRDATSAGSIEGVVTLAGYESRVLVEVGGAV